MVKPSLLLLLLCGAWVCSCGAGPGGDGSDSGESSADAACEGPEPYDGASLGAVDCSADVCTVAAGEFWMGAPNPDAADQCPPRKVMLAGFAIDRSEVTFGRYDACVADLACTSVPSHCRPGDVDDGDRFPVTCADHDQAVAFCAWVGGALPTEAQWEKAARGTDGARWPWGGTPPNCTTANFREVTTYCEAGTVPVVSYPTSMGPFGLFDTVGNAWEWTADGYDAGYYRRAGDVDPPGPQTCSLTVDGERGDCDHRVIRGGAFNTLQATTESSSRSHAAPALQDTNIGFRCAYALGG